MMAHVFICSFVSAYVLVCLEVRWRGNWEQKKTFSIHREFIAIQVFCDKTNGLQKHNYEKGSEDTHEFPAGYFMHTHILN